MYASALSINDGNLPMYLPSLILWFQFKEIPIFLANAFLVAADKDYRHCNVFSLFICFLFLLRYK